MPEENVAVRLTGSGVFYADINGVRRNFYNAEGVMLTRNSAPCGAWPFFYQERGGHFLYFQYFLSATVHQWSLSSSGQPVESRNIDVVTAGFFEDNLMTSPDASWLKRKTVDHHLDLNSVGAVPECPFSQFEYACCNALLADELNQFVLNNVIQCDPYNICGRGFLFDAELLRHLDVPDGYREAVRARLGTREITDALENLSDSLTVEIDKVQVICDKLARAKEPPYLFALTSFALGGFRDYPDETCCEVHFDSAPQTAHDESRYCTTLRFFFSKLLISSRFNKEMKEQSLERIGYSIWCLAPHLMKFAEQARSFSSLYFSFSDAGRETFLSFDRPHGSKTALLPDLYILADARSLFHVPEYSPKAFKSAFKGKLPMLFWRGSTTGSWIASIEQLEQNKRVIACSVLKEKLPQHADCKITAVVQCEMDLATAILYLRHKNIFAAMVQEKEFARYQLYLDLEGNGAAWGTYRKYLSGCAVLRPFPAQRELAYYNRLIPFEDFFPVKPDLSDIVEIVEDALGNVERAACVAYSGRRKMIQYLNEASDNVYATFDATATR